MGETLRTERSKSQYLKSYVVAGGNANAVLTDEIEAWRARAERAEVERDALAKPERAKSDLLKQLGEMLGAEDHTQLIGLAAGLLEDLDTLKARNAELVATLRATVEAVEASLPEGDEEVGLQEFPSLKLSEVWERRRTAREVLKKARGK